MSEAKLPNPVVPSIQEQAAFHDDWNAKYRKVGFDEIEEESRVRADTVLKYLDYLALQPKHPEILEVGCGTGWLTEKLINRGHCTAVDLSEKAIAIANQRGLDATRVSFMSGDFSQMLFEPEKFDVAVMLETIAYVSDQAAFLEKIASHLKSGGHLLLTTVNTFVYSRCSDIGPPQPGLLRKWLTRKELTSLLANSFEVVRQTTVLPKGNRGILRVINSTKINRLFNTVFSEQRVRQWKEWAGLGHTRVVMARKK